MNFRLTAALFGIVIVFVGALLVLSIRDKKTTSSGVLTAEMAAAGITAEKSGKVDSVEFVRADGATLLVVRTDEARNTWEIQKPIAARADTSKVLPVITALLRAKPVPYNELSSNPAVHGLDPPGLKVTIRQGDQRSSTVNLGDVTMGDKGVVFVTTSARPERPMAVRRSDLADLFRDDARDKDGKAVDLAKWTADFRTPSVFPSESPAMGEDVTFLKLDLPVKKKELTLSRSPGGWKFVSPAGWGDADAEGDSASAPDKFTGVGPLLRALANVAARAPADFIDQPKDMKEYGLNDDNPDRVRVEMKTRDGQSAVVYLGKIETAAPPPAPKIPGAPPPPPNTGTAYAKVEGQPGVIRVSATNLGGLAALIADPAPLRDRNLLNVPAGKQSDGLDILLAGQAPDKPIKLRRVTGEWRLYGGPGDPQKAYDPAVSKLVDVLTAKRTVKDFPAPNPANFAAVSATVYVWIDGFNAPSAPNAEPTKRAEPVKLEFGRREGDTVYVRRTLPDKQVNEFALPSVVRLTGTETAELIPSVEKTRLDLLDQTLPSFSDTAAVRVAVTGANTYTLAKDEKPDPATKQVLWRFTAPDARKGQVADAKQVEAMLTLLATAQGTFGKFVDENPTPEKLAGYGLSPPRLKVAVGTDAKSENDRGFEFGKDAADPDKVYARVIGKAAVFTIQRRSFDQFANPDLRDRVLFRAVPASAVTRIEMKGWGHLIGKSPIALVLEKNKDGVWAVAPAAPGAPANAPAGFVVDPAKVDAFLALIASSRAKSFETGPPTAKHGFGDPDQFLEVKLTWPGAAVALNIGATPDMGATYYGWSSWLPQSDPVFTIDGGLLKPFKTAPSGFAK